MRVSPAFRVKGRIGVKCQSSANPDDRSLQKMQKRAGSKLHVRYVEFHPDLNEAIGLGISMFKTWSGLSSNDGGGFV
jgi:hypothetical protein